MKVMGELLRGKMLDALRRLHADGAFCGFDAFDDPEGFERLATRLARVRWHVYAKKPFRKALHLLRYLGRYTHRVAISSSRLVAITDDAVTFRTKNGKTTPVEFLRRFIQHVLPDGLHKIRHYGLYAGVNAATLVVARTAISCGRNTPARVDVTSASWPELLLAITGRDVTRCPRCGGALDHTPVVASARAPPAQEPA